MAHIKSATDDHNTSESQSDVPWSSGVSGTSTAGRNSDNGQTLNNSLSSDHQAVIGGHDNAEWIGSVFSEFEQHGTEGTQVVTGQEASWVGESFWDGSSVAKSEQSCGRTAALSDSENSDFSWLLTIWDAVDFEEQDREKEEIIETVQVMPPQSQPEASNKEDLFVSWKYDPVVHGLPLMSYPLNISAKDPRELACCGTCRKEVAVMVLHDESPQHHEPHLTEITCVRCYLGITDPNLPLKVAIKTKWNGNKKRRNEGSDTKVWCDICYHHIAYGGMRLDSRDSGWHPVDFRVEYLCANCVQDFNHCSLCPSLGSYRKGTWRPRQTFRVGETKCAVPHTNQIKKRQKFQFVSYVVPNLEEEVPTWDPDVITLGEVNCDPCAGVPQSERIRRFADICLSNYKLKWIHEEIKAKHMRNAPHLWTWEKLPAIIEAKLNFIELNLIGKYPRHESKNIRKYAALGYVTEDDDPASGATSSSRLRRKTREREREPQVVTFDSWYWYVEGRHVQMMDFGHVGSAINNKLEGQAIVARVSTDCARYGLPEPKFFWVCAFKNATDANLDPYDLRYESFISIVKYARDRGLDPEKVLAELANDVPYILRENSKVCVIPWDHRSRFGDLGDK